MSISTQRSNRKQGFIKKLNSPRSFVNNKIVKQTFNSYKNNNQQDFNQQFSQFQYKYPLNYQQEDNQFSLFKINDPKQQKIRNWNHFEQYQKQKQNDQIQYNKEYGFSYKSQFYKPNQIISQTKFESIDKKSNKQIGKLISKQSIESLSSKVDPYVRTLNQVKSQGSFSHNYYSSPTAHQNQLKPIFTKLKSNAIPPQRPQVEQSEVFQSEPSYLADLKKQIQIQKQLLFRKKQSFQNLKNQQYKISSQSLSNPRQIIQTKGQHKIRTIKNNKNRNENQENSFSQDSCQQQDYCQQQNSSQQQNSQAQNRYLTHRQEQFQNQAFIPQYESKKHKYQQNNQTHKQLITVMQQQSSLIQHIPLSQQIPQKQQISQTKFFKHKQNKNTQIRRNQEDQRIRQYEEQGILVTKGGLSFQMDIKIFQKQKNIQQIEQLKPKKNKPQQRNRKNTKKHTIDQKQQLLRRRQLAKNYDRSSRNLLFG